MTLLVGNRTQVVELLVKYCNQTDVKVVVSLDTLQEAKQKQSGRNEILDDMSKTRAGGIGKKASTVHTLYRIVSTSHL